ncbi:phosphoribosylpyrophosphate synthetase [Chitinophaga polysaccharea]|uniref:phosphoribosylpyrophosphate synthetase n=1 Tax=Chitinophaga polysaccharea TaxID=1293035 RepID=UPI001455DAE9|nr:phosphoribosylpyrophosphate synthetase [Chitinophaga polysaccharea]NLR59369.1 phosphoribosylpyrophosphate synthetase [Chitinophaga polysaccharea]
MKKYLSLTDALSDLKQRGYNADFTAETDTFCLYSGEFDTRLDPREFHVDECYRFDCNSNYNSNAVLYAISAPASGVKGTLIDETGTLSCSLVFDNKLQILLSPLD